MTTSAASTNLEPRGDEALSKFEADKWLVQAVQENVMRLGLDADERRDAIQAMRAEAMSQQGIAQAFRVGPAAIRTWERRTSRATQA